MYGRLLSIARWRAIRHSGSVTAAASRISAGTAASAATAQARRQGTTSSSGSGCAWISVSSSKEATRLGITPSEWIRSSGSPAYWTTVRMRWPSWGNRLSISAAVRRLVHHRNGEMTRPQRTTIVTAVTARRPAARTFQGNSSR